MVLNERILEEKMMKTFLVIILMCSIVNCSKTLLNYTPIPETPINNELVFKTVVIVSDKRQKKQKIDQIYKTDLITEIHKLFSTEIDFLKEFEVVTNEVDLSGNDIIVNIELYDFKYTIPDIGMQSTVNICLSLVFWPSAFIHGYVSKVEEIGSMAFKVDVAEKGTGKTIFTKIYKNEDKKTVPLYNSGSRSNKETKMINTINPLVEQFKNDMRELIRFCSK
jgi:hypothetical protein